MPYVNIRIAGSLSREQKASLPCHERFVSGKATFWAN